MDSPKLHTHACAGRQIRLYAPTERTILNAVDGRMEGPGDAELHTWSVPWDSGLFLQMTHWDLSALDVLDLGCGLGLAGCFAAQQGARSVFFTDRSEVAVALALRSAAENSLPSTAVHGMHGSWSETSSWPQVDVILGNEILYVESACEELTALLQSPVLRPGGLAAFCGSDRGLWNTFEHHLIVAGFHVRCGNGFAPAADGSPQPTVLLLVSKPGQGEAAPQATESIIIRPEAWNDTGACRAKLTPPPCVAGPVPPPPPPPLPA
jgi:SAM-dependent methyltransferase